MTSGKTKFQAFLEAEVNKTKGIYYPVKAGLFRRHFVKSLPCSKLHPNPNDEFCFPDIGPNYEIIANYREIFLGIRDFVAKTEFEESEVREPIVVEKISPDGYMILNGHHRWAAALQIGLKRLPVQIVDLTQETDIQKMLRATGFHKRVTLDLDEVVFCPDSDSCLEKGLPFPANRIFKERIRLGIPALFHTLNSKGYDIWIYTAKYYSLDYLRRYFWHYRVHVTGIVTGTARKGPPGTNTMKELEKVLETKYKSTVHIDNDMVLRTFRGERGFEDYPLNAPASGWSRKVVEIIERMKPHE